MTRWMLLFGIVVFVSVHQWVEADTLSYLTKKVLDQLKKLDKEFPKSRAANKKCQNGIENIREWFTKKEKFCRAQKNGEPRNRCDDEMARNVEVMGPLLEILHEYCKGR
ncbi:uncharacterized protein LOC124367780 isoform X2 [Homalodisca vitripennis]|uniref:uncharacterized protein LOC124367780 isoform X2 n=1 Tax=Homalodisca vitripennis TaxID=197043 RepID=UPI001EEA1BAD|nr:uncharacterized protein LOC124367780 isoform X2 [Homalodisca vitripennis]